MAEVGDEIDMVMMPVVATDLVMHVEMVVVKDTAIVIVMSGYGDELVSCCACDNMPSDSCNGTICNDLVMICQWL